MDSSLNGNASARPAGPASNGGHGVGTRTAPAAGRPAAPRPDTFPFAVQSVVLRHPPTMHAYDHCYDSYRRAFYHITSVLQQLRVDQGVELVQAYLDQLIEESLNELRTERAELQRRIQERTGSPEYDIEAPTAQRREAKVPSYAVRRYLEVFLAIDDYITCVIYAESCGVLPWTQRRRMSFSAPRHAANIHDRFLTLARLLNMRELGAESDALGAVQSIVARVAAGREDEPLAPADAPTLGEGATATAEQVATAVDAATPETSGAARARGGQRRARRAEEPLPAPPPVEPADAG
jgi:hypothetical protein